MKRRDSRRSSASSDSTATSQISPKSTEHPGKQRHHVSRSPCSPISISTEEKVVTEFRGDENVLSLHDGGLSGESTLNVCLCQPDPKIPRPRNAFILYRQHHQPGITAQYPGLTAPQISKIIGERWRQQPEEIKNEWKTRAEEVKLRHQLQYPDYRYQPRRSSRRNSTIDSPVTLIPKTPCPRCGGCNTTSPTTPILLDNSRPMVPPLPPSSSAKGAQGHYLPTMNNFTIMSPHHMRGPVHPVLIPSFPYLAPGPAVEEDKRSLLSPDSKRLRLSDGMYYSVGRQSINGPHPASSPYQELFVRRNSVGDYTPGFMAPPPRPSAALLQAHRPRSLTLPPIQIEAPGKGIESTAMSTSYVGKIAILGRISPPFKVDGTAGSARETRGAVVAIVGDDQVIVAEVVKWLGGTLGHKPDFKVRTAQGPMMLSLDRELVISDYLSMIMEWHPKSQEIVTFITAPATPVEDTSGIKECPVSKRKPIPIVLLERYQLYASDAYAAKIMIKDNYSPVDHWQWMATMWRDLIGPDLTVFIKDKQNDDEIDVEVRKDVRCITVRKKKATGPEETKLGETELRRLAFEIGEWARVIAQPKPCRA